jgi:uncharacterized cofD-like protein
MFDAGGSSGRLRDEDGVLPPSDLLRCAAALSPYPYVRDILNERIKQGEEPYHTGGNLLLAKLEQVYGRRGAVQALGELFRVQGTVLPVSYSDANLTGSFKDGTDIIRSEPEVDAGIAAGRVVLDLSLSPRPEPNPDALDAIAKADVIVVGPGSFFTSLLPNFLVPGVRDAVAGATAPIVAVMNLLAEGADMVSVRPEEYVRAWERDLALGRGFSRVILNDYHTPVAREFQWEQKYPVYRQLMRTPDDRLVWYRFWDGTGLARHDPDVLARALQIELTRTAA